MAVVWRANALAFKLGQQPQTTKVPKGISARHIEARALGHISLFPPSLARLPIPLFLATYTAYTSACYRAASRSTLTGSTPLQGLALSSVFLAPVSASFYRCELPYKHVAQTLPPSTLSTPSKSPEAGNTLANSQHGTELWV